MGASCSKVCQSIDHSANDHPTGGKLKLSSNYYHQGQYHDVQDHQMNQLMKRSLNFYGCQSGNEALDCGKESAKKGSQTKMEDQCRNDSSPGQYRLLYKQQQKKSMCSHVEKENRNFMSMASKSRDPIENVKEPLSSVKSTMKKSTHLNMHPQANAYPTRLVQKRHPVRSQEEGIGGNHVYAVRWPAGKPLAAGQDEADEDDNNDNKTFAGRQEQCPPKRGDRNSFGNVHIFASGNSQSTSSANTQIDFSGRFHSGSSKGTGAPVVATTLASSSSQQLQTPSNTKNANTSSTHAQPRKKCPSPPTVLSLAADVDDPSSMTALVDHLFQPSAMCAPPSQKVLHWVTVSAEHNIYIADVGMTLASCDRIVAVTEHVCRGQYAAYTYAKQTLGCREYPELAAAVQNAVHTVTHAILEFSAVNSVLSSGDKNSLQTALALDDREPHIVKYDVTKKERQKLDMHTDKSEWTFLISLSNGCGLDYSGGGTYFECLDSTIHIQRGHALIFPGKLRHCGQRITNGLRFLLVGFLVDKSPTGKNTTSLAPNTTNDSIKLPKDDTSTSSEPPSYMNAP